MGQENANFPGSCAEVYKLQKPVGYCQVHRSHQAMAETFFLMKENKVIAQLRVPSTLGA